MHLEDRAGIARESAESPAALMVFDLLRDGDTWLLDEPWTERRTQLESLLGGLTRTARGRAADPVAMHIRLAPTARGRG
jgi:ATP-dependent DNA ligase